MKFEKPYYIVIFISQLSPNSRGYDEMATKMVGLAKKQPGFLGIESIRSESGKGITLSYWKNLESIRAWKHLPEHQAAQALGKSQWYEAYSIEIAKVE